MLRSVFLLAMAFFFFAGKAIGNTNQIQTTIKAQKPSELIRELLGSVPKISEQQMADNILIRTYPGKTGVFLARYPALLTFCVKFIKDKKALPLLAEILEDQKRLGHFGLSLLGTFILGLILKWNRSAKTGRPMLSFFPRFFLIFALRLGVIFYFFGNELAPTITLAKEVASYPRERYLKVNLPVVDSSERSRTSYQGP